MLRTNLDGKKETVAHYTVCERTVSERAQFKLEAPFINEHSEIALDRIFQRFVCQGPMTS